jgi:hypothetical protein
VLIAQLARPLQSSVAIAAAIEGGASIHTSTLEITMRSQDKLVIGSLIFCALVSAAAGCGSGGGGKVDSGTADTANHAGDAGTRDLGSDTPQRSDGAVDAPADVPSTQDGAAIDRASVDRPADGVAADAAEADALSDAGDASSDAATLTHATITFVLKNAGATPVYLTSQCWTEFQVARLADGTVYENKLFCMCACSETACQGDIKCSPCAPRSGIAVAAGGSYELSWVAQTDSIEKRTGARGEFSCISHAPIATGTYRLSVPIFGSSSDAVARANAKTVNADFELGTANARVEVTLP